MTAESLGINRAGQELANLDLRADASGKYTADALRLEVRIPGGTLRLPSQTPRELQSLEQRPDIVVGRRAVRERRKGAPGAAAKPAPRRSAPQRSPSRSPRTSSLPGSSS